MLQEQLEGDERNSLAFQLPVTTGSNPVTVHWRHYLVFPFIARLAAGGNWMIKFIDREEQLCEIGTNDWIVIGGHQLT